MKRSFQQTIISTNDHFNKRSFQQNGSWKYIVVFADETVPVDHNDMEKLIDDVKNQRIKTFMNTY